MNVSSGRMRAMHALLIFCYRVVRCQCVLIYYIGIMPISCLNNYCTLYQYSNICSGCVVAGPWNTYV